MIVHNIGCEIRLTIAGQIEDQVKTKRNALKESKAAQKQQSDAIARAHGATEPDPMSAVQYTAYLKAGLATRPCQTDRTLYELPSRPTAGPLYTQRRARARSAITERLSRAVCSVNYQGSRKRLCPPARWRRAIGSTLLRSFISHVL